MDQTYTTRKPETDVKEKEPVIAEQGPSLEALRSGAAAPSPEQRGRQVDLPEAMRAKMENAFGADLSAVRLYESRTVAEAGAKAVTQGSDIAFAPGMLDFTSFGGQALLGHELSHVVSQARGEVTGGGYLENASLEARADREGAMAAAGQTVAQPMASLSPVTAAAAAGPMQAARDKKGKQAPNPAAAQAAAPGAAPAPTPAPAPAQAAAPAPTTGYGFDTGPQPAQLPDAAAIRADIGSSHSRSIHHGRQFRRMMSSLNTLSGLRQGKGDMGAMAREAMVGNAGAKALADMVAYRDRLVQEGAHKRGYQRQIDKLNTLIQKAQADQAAAQAAQNVTLPGQEFTGTVHGGAINKVFQYHKGGESGYFKPEVDRSPVPYTASAERQNERSSMKTAGVIPESLQNPQRLPDALSLSKREVAFARLGSLLGSDVVLGAKLATLGGDTDPARNSGDQRYAPGGTGVLTEEAKGREWYDFGWQFPAILAPDRSTGQPAQNPKNGTLTPEEKILEGPEHMRRSDFTPTTVGDRLKEQGYSIGTRSTAEHSFDHMRDHPGDPQALKKFTDEHGGPLNMADPTFQRQMNEMFLLDALAGHRDRHEGNFLVNPGQNGQVSLKAIDNDLTFGTFGKEKRTDMEGNEQQVDMDAVLFGKKNLGESYTGMPASMQIDAAMAQRIRKMDRATLDLALSDLLDKNQMDALETRFGEMRKYIDAMEKQKLLVKQWDDSTARKELELASGNGSGRLEDQENPGGFYGNNYYQRQALMLNIYGNAQTSKDKIHI